MFGNKLQSAALTSKFYERWICAASAFHKKNLLVYFYLFIFRLYICERRCVYFLACALTSNFLIKVYNFILKIFYKHSLF